MVQFNGPRIENLALIVVFPVTLFQRARFSNETDISLAFT